MKRLTVLFSVLLAVSAFAFGNDGNNSPGFMTSPTLEMESRGSADWDITVTSTNSFTCPYAQSILGLDYHLTQEALVFSSVLDDCFYLCEPEGGTYLNTRNYDWTHSNVFGVVMVSTTPYIFYCDDWSDSFIHIYRGGWTADMNPVGDNGRGMDFDGTDTWITNDDIGVCRFQLGVGQVFYTLSEPQNQLSGLTTFPHGANLGMMVTAYDDLNFYFYEVDGSNMVYLGSTPVPVSCNTSYGLAYSASRDSFFWSYRYGGIYYIDELDISITGSNIEETTWGQIKADF